jgi:lysozyme family protein
MTARFEKAFNTAMKHEGFYANVPGDAGGETYRGISRVHHPTWRGWPFVDAYKTMHGGKLAWNTHIKDDALDLMVKDFYHKNFWQKILGDSIKTEAIALFIFDFFIHSGGRAVRTVQGVLQDAFNQQIAVDGAFGPKTLAALNAVPDQGLLHDLIKQNRMTFLVNLARQGANAKFLAGWVARVDSFPDLKKKS